MTNHAAIVEEYGQEVGERALVLTASRLRRTITDVDLYEFGPVTFGAYAEATSGLRSGTDEWMRSLQDPLFVARLTERLGANVVSKILTNGAPDGQPIASLLPDSRGIHSLYSLA